MKLQTQPCSQNLEALKTMKLYPGALCDDLIEVLDQDSFEGLPLKVIWDKYPALKHITFVRHLESNYNSIKAEIKNSPEFHEFKQEKDQTKKSVLFQKIVDVYNTSHEIDYLTGLSEKGHNEGEKMSKLYAELIEKKPSLMSKIIIVSPYLRTRLTTYYLLKNIKGLDLDVDHLKERIMSTDVIEGSFNGQKIEIRCNESIRERDHGINKIPTFLRSFSPDGSNKERSSDDHAAISYFNAPDGGESQTQVNARVNHFLSMLTGPYHKEDDNILVVSHHLAMTAALLSVFNATIHTFEQINNNRQPQNGSFAFLSLLEKSENGKERALRASGRNIKLCE